MLKRIYIALILASLAGTAWAQQQIMFTQYMFNMLALNPAYAGVHDGISTTFLAREQWAGFEGAPSTQTFSIHSPLKFRTASLGAVFIRDQIGITTQLGTNLSYAYRINLGSSRLSFGIQSTFNNYKSDFLSAAGNMDPNITENVSEFRINFGTGLLWHADRFYASFSIPTLFKNEINKDLVDGDSKLVRHYFLAGGYVFDVGREVKLKPNILLKGVKGAPIQVDLNMNVLLKNIIWVGLSYRSLDSFDAIFQLQLTPQLQLGYSYDFATTTELRRVNSGSHEIMLNYVFNFKRNKVLTPRYF